MWTFFGSWLFILLLLAASLAGLFVGARRQGGLVLAWVIGGALVGSGVLLAVLLSPVTAGDGVHCGTTIGRTQSETTDHVVAEELAAGGAQDYTDDCTAAARPRYVFAVGGYLLVVLGTAAWLSTARRRSPA